MKSLIVSTASAAAVMVSNKRKTMPRSKFTRNTLRRRIQERELEAEILEGLDELRSQGSGEEDEDFDSDYGYDEGGWDPYVEERWDEWRSRAGYGGSFSYCGFDSNHGFGGCDDDGGCYRHGDDRYGDDRYGDDRYGDDRYGGDDSFDDDRYAGCDSLDHMFAIDELDCGYPRYRRRYRFAESWPPENGVSDCGQTLADVLIESLLLRSSELEDTGLEGDEEVQFFDGNEEVPEEYFEGPPLLCAAYDRQRFSTERFVRLPGRKVRFKKNKEQRGGNRRARSDYGRWIETLMDDGHYERSRLHPDGSRKVQSINRHHCGDWDGWAGRIDAIRARIALSDAHEMVEDYFEERLSEVSTSGRNSKTGGAKNRRGNRSQKRGRAQVTVKEVVVARRSNEEVLKLNEHIRSVLFGMNA